MRRVRLYLHGSKLLLATHKNDENFLLSVHLPFVSCHSNIPIPNGINHRFIVYDFNLTLESKGKSCLHLCQSLQQIEIIVRLDSDSIKLKNHSDGGHEGDYRISVAN